MDNPTIGYHLIRGLGAPLRMMMFYKETPFTNVAYGKDMKEEWFADDKPRLLKQNSCINLPYIVDGDTVVTQSNTCLVYLGQKLGIDAEQHAIHNHTVLDQTMDLRNDLMKVVYPFSGVTKETFPEAAKKHLAGSAKTHLTKLEGFCRGPYMCGAAPQSGDFALFEMLDQHESMSKALGVTSPLDGLPKLKALHAAMQAEPTLARYFASDLHTKYFQNNGIFTFFSGQPEAAEYGTVVREKIDF